MSLRPNRLQFELLPLRQALSFFVEFLVLKKNAKTFSMKFNGLANKVNVIPNTHNLKLTHCLM
ncbi:hypothetical protein, partial [Streptococcus pneumoniae]|uniref:hypothetical protein n=1 Tax=Streptococcus pneumoniae TaxID=1313 RepID=UPI001E3C25E5